MKTYWLYYGDRVTTAVRLPEGATDQEVREKARWNEERCPIGHQPYETPAAFRTRIHHSHVRTFE